MLGFTTVFYGKRMHRVVVDFGPIVLHTYEAWLLGSLAAALAVIVWRAHRFAPGQVLRWLDVGIVAALAGITGARGLYVMQQWDHFADHPDQITRLSLGGMAWHGAVLVAVPAAVIAARLRGVPVRAWLDAAALAWPLGMIGAWRGCREAGCGYGYEVATLASWPGWQVEELPDIYEFVAPRLDVQVMGMALGSVLLALALLLTWRGWLPGVRLWIILALTGLGQAILAFLRADPAQTLLDHRADQVFDLALLLVSTVLGSAVWLATRQQKRG